MSAQRFLLSAAVLAAFSVAANAQSVVSAHSGTLHYFEGVVTIDDKAAEQHPGKFNEIKENGVLRTELGRAEVLLTPGVFLRVGENSAIKILDNRLLSTRVELLSGTVIVESDDPDASVKDPAVTIVYKDYQIQPVKFGLFELSADANQMKVFKGQATVVAGGNRAVVKDGRMMPFSAALLTEKFDEKNVDDLYLWTRDRSAHLSAANMASARSLNNKGYTNYSLMNGQMSGFGYAPGFGGNWFYNSFLGMFTYIPYGGTVWSPFGYGYFSPLSIYSYYSPSRYNWNGGGTARNGTSTGVALTSIGTSGVAASQIARYGSGMNSHPTLGSPVRSADNMATNSTGFRGGDFGGNPAAGGRFGGAAVQSSSPAMSAPAAAPARAAAAPSSGGGAGGARGR